MTYRPLVRGVSRSAGTGALLAFLVVILAYVSGSDNAITAYLQPGIVLAGFLSPLVPSAVVYWVEPEGGPYAFLLITLVCAFFFWTALLGAVHFVWRRAKAPDQSGPSASGRSSVHPAGDGRVSKLVRRMRKR
jgi:hypothetical protein